MKAPTAPVTIVALVTLALLITGCGGSRATGPGAVAPTSSAAKSSGMHMDLDMGSVSGPSKSATMICQPEIQQAVKRSFLLTQVPSATPHWSHADRTFTCTYRLPRGRFVLSVQDALRVPQGHAHFAALKRGLPGAHPIHGLENFGFPALTTSRGEVAFLKDGKTLMVDATGVPTPALPKDFTREDVAYSVASAVVACWSE